MQGLKNRARDTDRLRTHLTHGLWIVGSLAVLTSSPSIAHAAGYDTPILYSARHAGMGGTAVSYVRDSSALFLNPAGLGNIGTANVLADFSLVTATVEGSPADDGPFDFATSIESELITAPFFLIGGSYRITDWLVVGAGVYPVASATAEYQYDRPNLQGGQSRVTDDFRLVFLETSPAVAVNLPESWGLGKINLGFSYRIIYAQLSRSVQAEGSEPDVDAEIDGFSFDGYRLGLQWAPIDHLSFGVHYRSKTTTDLEGDEGVVTTAVPPDGALTRLPLTDISGSIVLPARLAFGARGDYAGFGLALDVEYAFQSQNEKLALSAQAPPVTLNQVLEWEDAWTIRVGGEYKVELESLDLFPRLGYVYDGRTTNPTFVSAFGTPPTETHSITAGLGLDFGSLEFAVAYAYRFGSTSVDEDEIDPEGLCDLCSFAGDYSLTSNAFFIDVSYDFE